jgi:glucose/arabinose dehydrogenase
MNRAVNPAVLVLAVAALHRGAAAQCAKPADTDWQKTVLVDGNSPVKLDMPTNMSILPDGRILISEVFSGRIKLYTPNSGLTEAATIFNYPERVGNGIMGLALDPEFAENKWVYVFYARRLPGANYNAGDNNVIPHEHVLARMTFANGKLGNPKDILAFKRLTIRHGGGGMAFNNATGDLYLPTGDDVYPLDEATHWGGRSEGAEYLNDLRSAANTNDLRGKVLRIRPIPFPDAQPPAVGVGSTYSIPAGNLYPVGTARTRPEIFTMGHRNPYKIKIDPVSGFSLVGEVGPDAEGAKADRGPTGSDEFNLLSGPGNYGWPFGIADNQPYIAYDNEAYPKGTAFAMDDLKNKSRFNTGLEDLPPAIGAMAYYNARFSQTGANTVFGSGGETAIAGPYYRFDPAKPGVKMPAFFHGKWIAGDWSRNKIWSLELDDKNALRKVETLWTGITKIIDLAIGPDGDLYVLTLATGSSYEGDPNTGNLFKMQFKGAQYAVSACPQHVLPDVATGISGSPAPGNMNRQGNVHARMLANLEGGAMLQAPAGSNEAYVYDLDGVRIWTGRVQAGRFTLPGSLGPRLGVLQFR